MAKHPGGRPSKLNPQLAFKIFLLARRGLTDKEISQILDFDEKSIRNWKKSPEFFLPLKEAKAEADALVERSLFEKAVGFEHPEEKTFYHDGKVITHKTIRRYPPDTTACIYWLKNRQPEKWREASQEDKPSSVESVLQQIRRHQEEKARQSSRQN